MSAFFFYPPVKGGSERNASGGFQPAKTPRSRAASRRAHDPLNRGLATGKLSAP
jgi:hypothetical protein